MTLRPRIIPVLLLSDRGLVRSTHFADHRYVGDPLNAARIFSELGADELILLDIDATRAGRLIATSIVERIADEISMPLAVGGGVSSIEDVAALVTSGADKVVIGSAAWRDPYLIKEAVERYGSSTVSVCIDVKRGQNVDQTVHVINGTTDTAMSPVAFARMVEDHGAGEIVIQSIETDGTMRGYDIALVNAVSRSVSVPVVALGGAGTVDHLGQVVREGRADAVAAGSMFVYLGQSKAVLINYPSRNEVNFG